MGDQNLEELRPLGNSLYSGATDLDDAGNAVGYSYLNSSEPFYRTQAVLWENDFASGSHPVTAALQLANLPGRNINYPQGYGYARAIDRAGNLIVGQSLGEYPVAGAQPPRTEIRPAATAWVKNLARQTASGTSTAAWETIDLNDQISDKTWQLGNAVDVNTTGIIIGMGLHNGQTRAFLLLPVEIKVRMKGTTKAPDDGLLVKKSDVLEFAPQSFDTEDNFETLITWQQRQLKGDGTYIGWSNISAQATGTKFEHTTAAGGIFQIKAIITNGGEHEYKRKKDAPHDANSAGTYNEKLRKDQPDFVGITDNDFQIAVRNQAHSLLGSTAYAKSADITVGYGVDPTLNFKGSWKCNIFVFTMANAASATVPTKIWRDFVFGLPPFVDRPVPPGANDWYGSGYSIPVWAWSASSTLPQPGFAVMHQHIDAAVAGGAHMGLLDYDGTWINAGKTTVNKSIHVSDPDYQPTNYRKP